MHDTIVNCFKFSCVAVCVEQSDEDFMACRSAIAAQEKERLLRARTSLLNKKMKFTMSVETAFEQNGVLSRLYGMYTQRSRALVETVVNAVIAWAIVDRRTGKPQENGKSEQEENRSKHR